MSSESGRELASDEPTAGPQDATLAIAYRAHACKHTTWRERSASDCQSRTGDRSNYARPRSSHSRVSRGIGGAYARRGARDGVVRTQTVSDVGVMLGACLAGAGIAQVMALGVRDLLDQGQLIELFPDWPDETFPLCAVHPSRHHPPAKVRAFIDFCVETIR